MSEHLLSILIAIPLFGALVMLFLPRQSVKWIRTTSIAFMVVGPRGSNTAVAALSGAVATGVVANLLLVLGLSSFVRSCHRKAWVSERTRISTPEQRRRWTLRARAQQPNHDPAVRLALNRPGSDGGSQSMEDESHGSTQEVPRRAA